MLISASTLPSVGLTRARQLIIIIIVYVLSKCMNFINTAGHSDYFVMFSNSESHNNPLYLKPDEVTSEVANLYTPTQY